MYVRKNQSGVCPTLTANMGTFPDRVPIILDDYGVAGETDAVDEFFMNKDVEIKRLSISQHKPSYIIKSEM